MTRNRNAAAIATFLKAHGVPDVGVHVVPKGVAKGEFIRTKFFAKDDEFGGVSTEDSVDAIFVDDDIRELVVSEWLRNNKRINRILFVRVLD